jgi:hypothetical protein
MYFVFMYENRTMKPIKNGELKEKNGGESN